MNSIDQTSPELISPGFFRRFAAMFYDWFLLAAVILVAVSLFTIVVDVISGPDSSHQLLLNPWAKLLYQLYLLIIASLFYLWFWTHGGQTLGMKVWKLKVVTSQQGPVSMKQAIIRLLLAIVCCIPLGMGFFWMLFNRQKLTLYDKWSGTRLISIQSG